MRNRHVWIALLGMALAACSDEGQAPQVTDVEPPEAPAPVAPALVVDDVALADESEGANWLAYGRTYQEKRFSPLDQIRQESVGELSLDWVPEGFAEVVRGGKLLPAGMPRFAEYSDGDLEALRHYIRKKAEE
jgi:hypothetical protein